MLERKERSGEAAGAGPRAARGLPAVRSTLQQCGLLQDLIDISLSNLRGLRTKCAASNDLTQQEIRTLEVRGSAAAAGPDGSPARRSSHRGPGLPLPGAAGACPFLPVPGRGGRGRAERDAGRREGAPGPAAALSAGARLRPRPGWLWQPPARPRRWAGAWCSRSGERAGAGEPPVPRPGVAPGGRAPPPPPRGRRCQSPAAAVSAGVDAV